MYSICNVVFTLGSTRHKQNEVTSHFLVSSCRWKMSMLSSVITTPGDNCTTNLSLVALPSSSIYLSFTSSPPHRATTPLPPNPLITTQILSASSCSNTRSLSSTVTVWAQACRQQNHMRVPKGFNIKAKPRRAWVYTTSISYFLDL